MWILFRSEHLDFFKFFLCTFDTQNLRLLGICALPVSAGRVQPTRIHTRHRIILWALDDENRLISLVFLSDSVHSSPLIASCQKMPKMGFQRSHTHGWSHIFTWLPEGSSTRKNTSFEPSVIGTGSAFRSVSRWIWPYWRKKEKKRNCVQQFHKCASLISATWWVPSSRSREI
jgi:hypothetical protein